MNKSIAVFCFAMAFGGCEPATHSLPPAGPNAGTLVIQTEPKGAKITVDGTRIGNGPKSVELRPGPHRLKASLSGYFAAEQRVVVTGKQENTIMLTLVASH